MIVLGYVSGIRIPGSKVMNILYDSSHFDQFALKGDTLSAVAL